MKPLTADEIRAAMVNCSKGEAKRMPVPRDLADRPWDDLDFLGWRDPSGSDRGYLVAEHDDGGLTGILLRCVPPSAAGRSLVGRTGICSLCLTAHMGAGVTLMTAARRAKRDDSVGVRICANLDCPLYVRGIKKPPMGQGLPESLTLEEKASRLRENVEAFLVRV